MTGALCSWWVAPGVYSPAAEIVDVAAETALIPINFNSILTRSLFPHVANNTMKQFA